MTRFAAATTCNKTQPAETSLYARCRILAGESGGYDTVSTYFTEIFGLTLKVFGDLSEHDELIVHGSLSDRNLIGYYLKRGRLVATLVIGQKKPTEQELQRLIKHRVVVDPSLLADQSPDIHALLSSTTNRTLAS